MELFKRGAIFDLDGTLLDSLKIWQDADKIFFERRGLTLPEDYVKSVKTLDLNEAAWYTKTRFSLPDSPYDMITEWRELIREEYAFRVEFKPYALEYLQALWKNGVKLAIATSSEPELYFPALKRFGAEQYFSAFAATKDVGKGKDDPAVYLLAAKKLQLAPEECAVFEDILEGITSAKSAGFFTVAVSDSNSPSEETLLRSRADCYIDTFLDLLK